MLFGLSHKIHCGKCHNYLRKKLKINSAINNGLFSVIAVKVSGVAGLF